MSEETFTIPEITTARLRLRAHRTQDLDPLVVMWQDDATVRYVGGEALSREEVWAKALSFNGLWSVNHWGYWAVADRESDVLLGQVGFGRFRREPSPFVPRTPEAGWAIHPEHAGRGYALEAMAAALDWLDRECPVESATHCLIHPRNAPSLKLAEKLGYQPVSRTMAGGGLSVILVRQRPE